LSNLGLGPFRRRSSERLRQRDQRRVKPNLDQSSLCDSAYSRAHLITDKLHLDLPSPKAETPIEPLLDPSRLVVRLVAHEREATFRNELGVGDGGAGSEVGGSGEVGSEGVGGEGRGEVTEDESGPGGGRC
jgi:hypothetical protein